MQIFKWLSRIFNYFSLFRHIKHRNNIRKSKIIRKKCIEIAPQGYGKVINYLRKIDPYVFEELILSIIEESDILIFRNKSYSGDGGIDGIFKFKGRKAVIQCKRYGNYIKKRDVEELLQQIVNKKYILGLFVHTGKTGEQNKLLAIHNPKLIIISGSLLVDWIIGKVDIKTFLNRKLD